MSKRKIFFWLTLLVFLMSLYLLFTGSPLLNYALDDNDSFPLGTLITWAGMICLPLCILLGVKKLRKPHNRFYRFLGFMLRTSLFLAIIWAPVCYLLAGNWNYSFSEKERFQGGQTAALIFWRYSAAIPILALLSWLMHRMTYLVNYIREIMGSGKAS